MNQTCKNIIPKKNPYINNVIPECTYRESNLLIDSHLKFAGMTIRVRIEYQ